MKKKKNESNLMSIGEFAKLVGINITTLRHYDIKDAFNPAKYGYGINNKYRFYSPTQVMVVRMIRILTEIGVSIKEIAELKKSRTPEKLLKVLKSYNDMVKSEIHYLQGVHSVIRTFTGSLIDRTEHQ